MRFRVTLFGIVVLFGCSVAAFAQTAGETDQVLAGLVASIARTEQATLKDICTRRPLVETYLQTVPNGSRTPSDDHYYLSRVRLGQSVQDELYDDPDSPDPKTSHRSFFHTVAKAPELAVMHAPTVYEPHAFVEMLSPEIRGFDPDHYEFSILRQEWLGDIRTTVLTVEPKKKGMFRGRIWVEGQGHIVRFMGIFGGESSSHPRFVHFDSWRANVAPGVWLPSAIYIEQPVPGGLLRGQIRIWGYGIDERERYAATHVSVHVDGAVDHQDDGTSVDPLVALQEWKDLASDNILSKMESAGILAPVGSFEKILDQIVTNLSIPNNLTFDTPIKCRVLLTTPIEAMTAGNTIILSRGLIDSLPTEEAIASVIAFEMGHILVGPGIDTKYSFGDRTMDKDSDIYRELLLAHSPEEDKAAADKAVELLKKSMYASKLSNVGLYYRQMAASEAKLKELFRARMGDSLLSPDHTPWMLAGLDSVTPALQPDSLSQIAALPLGSNLVVDPWSGEVSLNESARIAPSSLDEKRPFEVMPVYFRLHPSLTSLPTQGTQTATK